MNQASDKQTSKNHGERAESATYTIGDLHGEEVTLLRRLLEYLAPRADDTLIFLGHYLDRGEDAPATIETLTTLATSCHCIFLRGNHDEALARDLEWLSLHALPTHPWSPSDLGPVSVSGPTPRRHLPRGYPPDV